MIRYKIIGPPGTGKTTKLLQYLEETLKSVPAENVAFVSFTRRGAYEGCMRAKKAFELKDAQLRYFRTLHSICFHALGLRKSKVLGPKHYAELTNALGMRFTGKISYEFLGSDGDRYLAACDLMRNNPEAFEEAIKDLDYKRLQFVAHNLARYKQQRGVMTFSDMLYEYYLHGDPLDVKVAFIDEAQDLTTLQWGVVEKAFRNADVMYIAGDDDQAIYEWAGADVQYFMDFEADHYKVLDYSARLPQRVFDYSSHILHNISNREEKLFRPRESVGVVDTMTHWSQLKEHIDGQTLILARNFATLKDVTKELRYLGINYLYKGESPVDAKAIRAIQLYEEWRKSPDDRERRHLVELYSDYFIRCDASLPWFEVFSNRSDATFYRALLANKVDFTAEPYVQVNTIHASKGSECDHVILALDFSPKVYAHYCKDPDSELRCLYVGATRAKERLTIKLREGIYGYPERLQEDANEHQAL